MDFNMVKSFCLHSLGFRGEKIIIEGCELSVIEKNGTWEVGNKWKGSGGQASRCGCGQPVNSKA